MNHFDRPLSPHLQVYKPQLTSLLSILHRATGVASFLGSLCLLVWLVALAWDASLYGFVQPIALSFYVQIIIFFWSLSLTYHLCNGIRHLAWDAGFGYELEEVYKGGYIVLAASLLITLLIWLTK